MSVPGAADLGVWYRLLADQSGRLRISTDGSQFDTVLSVWEGPPRHPMTEIDCNDDVGDMWSSLDLDVIAGTTYFVKAGGQASGTGHLVVMAEMVDMSVEAGVFLPFLARSAPIQ